MFPFRNLSGSNSEEFSKLHLREFHLFTQGGDVFSTKGLFRLADGLCWQFGESVARSGFRPWRAVYKRCSNITDRSHLPGIKFIFSLYKTGDFFPNNLLLFSIKFTPEEKERLEDVELYDFNVTIDGAPLSGNFATAVTATIPYQLKTLVDEDGNSVPVGETGEIVIHVDKSTPCGLFKGYYRNEEKTKEVWHDGLYHTGDTAWRDEDGYFWYVGRTDDVIKSSGYRIGPFEVESVIMELPYVLECAITPVPDEVRGQIVKATIVLTKGTGGSDALKKEIQEYVKTHTAPYKYPRIVVFRDELPKTISGKIQRNKL